MWFQKQSPRRRAVVDEPTTRRDPLWKLTPWQARVTIGTVIFFLLALLIGFIPGRPARSGPRGLLQEPIFSPVHFTIPNELALAELRRQVRLRTPPILIPTDDGRVLASIARTLKTLPGQVAHAATLSDLPASVAQRFPEMSVAALAWLKQQAAPHHAASYQQLVQGLVTSLREHPVVTRTDFNRIAAGSASTVFLAPSKRSISINNLLILGTAQKSLAPWVATYFPVPVRKCFIQYLANLHQPTYTFDATATHRLAMANAAKVPATAIVFHRGELLIPAGRVLTAGDRQLLAAARQSYLQQLHTAHPWWTLLTRPARVAVLLLLSFILALYVISREHELRSITRLAAFAGLMLITLVTARLGQWLGLAHLTCLLALLPLLLAAIIFAIVSGGRLAWGLAAINALLVAWAVQRGLAFFITALAGMTVLTFSLAEIRTRSKLLKIGGLAALAMLVAILAQTLAAGLPMPAAAIHWPTLALRSPGQGLQRRMLMSVIAAMAATFLALGLLPLIERAFHVATAMTLLELSDTNHPLLRRMAIEAPGTFNHSLIVGIMAEAAARSVGANALLCRVGAYYHDIGKLVKPDYFIENMAGRPNRHDKLAPTMSHLIIIGHVKDGIELAHEFRLPAQVCNFIAEHHGTTLVEPFFHAARDQQAKQALTGGIHGQVAETDFRYPGPKPQSRETAIVMICDAVESTVRSLPEATAGRIESAAHQLIYKRLLDQQFERCDLTLVDLSKIEESIVRTLAGVYHGRLTYPKPLAVLRPA
jgi:putative nucleotidyltransferase with HDIG domain